MPTIGAKAKWAEMWCNSQHALFPECLVTFAVLAEGIFSPVPSVKFFGLSNVVYSLAYVLQTSSSATMKLFTVTLHVSSTIACSKSSTIACSNLLALSASGRLSTMPSKSKNASSTKCSHSTSWVWMQQSWANSFDSMPIASFTNWNNLLSTMRLSTVPFSSSQWWCPSLYCRSRTLRQWKALIQPLTQKCLVSVWQKKMQQWLGIKEN